MPAPSAPRTTRTTILDVWSDIACPWCFLGKRRLQRALSEAGVDVTVRWRAFELQPDLPLDGAPRSFLEKKLGGAARLRAAQERLAGMGRGDGIAFAFEKQTRVSNTRLAHRAIKLAGGSAGDVVEAFFSAHFERGIDVSALETVVDVAASAGLDRDRLTAELRGNGGLDDVLADEALAHELGIEGVPCFVLELSRGVSGAQPVEVLRDFIRGAVPSGQSRESR